MDISPQCKYCKGTVYFEPGFTQNADTGQLSHEECLQQSGDDEGIIENLYSDKEHVEDYLWYFLGD